MSPTERGGCHGSRASVTQHPSLTWGALIFFIFLRFFFNVRVLWKCFVCSLHGCIGITRMIQNKEEGIPWNWIPWNWSRRELWVVMWMLGTRHRSSGRSAHFATEWSLLLQKALVLNLLPTECNYGESHRLTLLSCREANICSLPPHTHTAIQAIVIVLGYCDAWYWLSVWQDGHRGDKFLRMYGRGDLY